MGQELDTVIQQSLDNTVAKPISANAIHLISWMTKAGINMYPWWSPARDRQIRNFWKNSDHLSGAMYTLCSKMTSVPMRVQARDQSIKEHVKEAEEVTFRLLAGAEFGQGWSMFYNQFVEELAGTDNGVFAEIIGAGNPDGAIIGAPVTVRILDSVNCQRTGDPIFPVLFRDQNGRMSKLHYTRVMFASQMPSPIADMFGVGFCAISRAIGVAQNLIDILTYKAEKLGSRPHRSVLITQGGLDPDDMTEAFSAVAHDMDNLALSRYSKTVIVGNSTLPEADVKQVDLAGLPDNFEERTSVELGMATIALAFGMDARELFPSITAGATRADALIQHLKQRGKGPGQIVQQTELLFNNKFLPPHLEMVFDYQDDEQDRQSAETKEVRSRGWATSIKSTVIDNRTARKQAIEVGDLTRSEFEELELQDGRLPDGTTVLALFYSEDKAMKKLLDLKQDIDPLDIDNSNSQAVIEAIKERKANAQSIMVNSRNPDERRDARQAVAALDALLQQYQGGDEMLEQEDGAPEVSEDDLTQPDPRTRRQDLGRAKAPEIDSDELEPDEDDGVKEVGEHTASPFGENFSLAGESHEVDFSMILKTIESYRLNLRNAVRGLWSGQVNFLWFYEQMQSAVEHGFRQAWVEGLGMAGILPDEASEAERQMLIRETFNERAYIEGLANYIDEHSKARGGKLYPLYRRVEVWAGGYGRVMNMAFVLASGDQKLKWFMGATREHCEDCLHYEGKVYRASTWHRYNISPRAWNLSCHGVHCLCTLEPTKEKCTPGRPRSPRGG